MQSRKELQMKIDRIILKNIGPYEGLVEFDTQTSNDKNIVIIGGKNGAGKTTLFTAMRLCLYGYMSMGYKNANSYYTRAVKRLINNNAKKNKSTEAFVKLDLRIKNSRDVDFYEIERSWAVSDAIQESLIVKRNGIILSTAETADYEKYLLSLIPPELFNLYFFDGERIADFFLEDGGNTRMKNAFLTLCGYDIFALMQRNFKRLKSNAKGSQADILDQYISIRENAQRAEQNAKDAKAAYNLCLESIENCKAELKQLESVYENSGGISQERYREIIETIKDEEKKRDVWNNLLRKWANDTIPFIILKEQLFAVKKQISDEKTTEKYNHFQEVLQSDEITNLLMQLMDSKEAGKISVALSQHIEENHLSKQDKILDLSFEQTVDVMAQIEEFLAFENEKVKKAKNSIKNSIKITAALREELEHSNIEAINQYMKRKAELLEEQRQLLENELAFKQKAEEETKKAELVHQELDKIKNVLEEELKKESIQDISTKAIVMLDELQEILYHKQIEKVEQNFCEIVNKLMRKTQFIDDIKIDNDFNIKIYRTEEYNYSELLKLKLGNTKEQMIHLFGARACEQISKLTEGATLEDVLFDETIALPVELDQATLSNGEKQVFIMALYQALIGLSTHEVPFVIDTPFARIDTEHRENISEHFFSKLKGQIFVLSTNEEINEKHMAILQNKINRTFILENADNKKTLVTMNRYFEGSL